MTDAQAKLVIGGEIMCFLSAGNSFTYNFTGEQLLWTEQSGPQNLDPIVWPRAAASAEVFWTGEGAKTNAEILVESQEVAGRDHSFR